MQHDGIHLGTTKRSSPEAEIGDSVPAMPDNSIALTNTSNFSKSKRRASVPIIPSCAKSTRDESYTESTSSNSSNSRQGGLFHRKRRIRQRRRSLTDSDALDHSRVSFHPSEGNYRGPMPLGSDGLPLKGCLAAIPNPTKRRVSFTSVEIREYALTVGNHPNCVEGVPVQLDWDYSESEKRPCEAEDKITAKVGPSIISPIKREIILKDKNISLREIEMALRGVEITQVQRQDTLQNLDLQKAEEVTEMAKRRFMRFIKKTSKEDEQAMLWQHAHEIALQKAAK